jgi:hypothetical protein
MRTELQRQDLLIERLRRATTEERTAEAGSGFAADWHMAPTVPREREVSLELFEEDLATIPMEAPSKIRGQKVLRLQLDADRDGTPEQVRYLEPTTRAPIHVVEDRNYDGTIDAWMSYDEDGDGTPEIWERYDAQRMRSLALDQNGDGRPDTTFHYEGEHLARESHDSDADGRMDHVVRYREGRRVAAEEDRDRNGAMDSWITFGEIDGREVVAERALATRGSGEPNLFESYELGEDGSPRIAKRAEDLDLDGEIDVTSFYHRGKLIRREIASLALPPSP